MVLSIRMGTIGTLYCIVWVVYCRKKNLCIEKVFKCQMAGFILSASSAQHLLLISQNMDWSVAESPTNCLAICFEEGRALKFLSCSMSEKMPAFFSALVLLCQLICLALVNLIHANFKLFVFVLPFTGRSNWLPKHYFNKWRFSFAKVHMQKLKRKKTNPFNWFSFGLWNRRYGVNCVDHLTIQSPSTGVLLLLNICYSNFSTL